MLSLVMLRCSPFTIWYSHCILLLIVLSTQHLAAYGNSVPPRRLSLLALLVAWNGTYGQHRLAITNYGDRALNWLGSKVVHER